ncbi:MAG: serine hydrolase [Cyclobacteriaceae bacterium]
MNANFKLLAGSTLILSLLSFGCEQTSKTTSEQPELSLEERLLLRADSFELDTPYELPPGDALSHHSSGYAKIMCSAVFITGLDPKFAAESVGYFTSPYDQRSKVSKPIIDYDNNAVHIDFNGRRRTAIYTGSQGCVCLPEGVDSLFYEPKAIEKNLPDTETTPWPMGDLLAEEAYPEGIDKAKIKEAVDAAFNNPEGLTAAFVVTYKGEIIGERYSEGIDKNTSLESWSMGKSLTGTILATLIHQDVYDLWETAPIPEWKENLGIQDNIRIGDIMRMSSGIRFRAPQDPNFDPSVGYPDHVYVYTGSINSFQYAATRPSQWPPNTIGRYRNCDPVLANYLIRLGVESLGQDYHTYPQKALFDKIGVRNMVMETDPYGNFLTQGYEFGSARDWARLGNLYLNDGVWQGERLLPEGYVKYASTLAPAWVADGRPIYGGGFFWINGEGSIPIPKDAYFMAGAGNQKTFIIPSHDLVVVRLGHYKGSSPGNEDLNNALSMLMEVIPEG